ncbi:iron complex outermembrane receptor protein [Sinobacterium caligoides]|uniref:Iron complex outermembrane receptor protein n=1 Tax=Sinobacterium caligoides TaxID=933926 RepID=A0A3N2DPF4_9GAMM|nr:TonB-dependent receptor [Sinobacterium caligoides]ROS01677.1 iron complex outermembrane receptor protein [Sinobacterium caligoides]
MKKSRALCLRKIPAMVAAVTACMGSTISLANAQALALEEVVVTARHKSENLQSVPIAVSAFGGEALKNSKIEGLGDLAGRVPGFQINTESASEPNLFIRGIGSDMESAGSDSAVGLYVDGVFMSRGAAAAAEIFDLERLEVLRGPQGTLYGKNVVGGAISYITSKPSQETEAMIDIGVGNYGLVETKGFVNGGLTDSLAGRISVSSTNRDGFAENTHTGNKVDDRENLTARGQLAYEFSDSLDVNLSVDQYKQNTTAPWRSLAVADTSIGEGDRSDKPWQATDPRKGASSMDGQQKVDLKGAAFTVNWDADSVMLTSITAYRENNYITADNAAGTYVSHAVNYQLDDNENNWDYDPSASGENPHDYPSLMWNQHKTEHSSQFSQEFRFNGAGFDEKLDWLAGVYYAREKVAREEQVESYFDIHEWYTFGEFGHESNATGVKTDTYAAFAQGSWHFDEQWSLTVGVRHSIDKKDFSAERDAPADDITYDVESSETWGATTGNATLNFQATDEIFIYGTVSQGYKAGGWNGEDAKPIKEGEGWDAEVLVPAGDVATISYDPEHATNFELGAKTQWLDNRIQLNGALFNTVYEDLQTDQLVDNALGAPAIITTNAEAARSRGLELELIALLSEGLTLSGTYGYLDTEITGDLFAESDVNLKGNSLRRSPENTVSVSLSYDWELASGALVNARADYRYQDAYFYENNNAPITEVDSQFSVDAALRYVTADGNWEAKLWAKNLTDELTVSSVTEWRNLYETYAAPRTYGANVTWRY